MYFRHLCVDAIVEEVDTNFDWRVSYQEYKAILTEELTPSSKHEFIQIVVKSELETD